MKFKMRIGWWELLVAIVVGLMVIVTVKYFGKGYEKEVVRIDFISNVSDNRGGQYYPSWFNNVLKVGDEERGPDGRVSAKILKKDSYQQADERFKYYLIIELVGLNDKRSGFLKYKGRPVQVGQEIEIDFPQVKVGGIVTHIGESSYLKKANYLVSLKWEDQDREIAEKIKTGQVVLNYGTGEEIGKIEKVGAETANDKMLLNNTWERTQVVVGTNRVDVNIKIRLVAETDGGIPVYAGNQKLKIGEPLWVYCEEVDIKEARVVGLELL
ncbi:MAG: hypothetical protein AAB574_02945 [Patescibacteria group bacterium]